MKRHLKTLASPRTWPLHKKQRGRFVTKPLPNAIILEHVVPINIALMLLNKAKTNREVRYIIHNHQILIDSVRVKSHKTPIGLFSVLGFPELKEYYRLLISTKHKLYFKKIPEKEADLTIARIDNKTMIKHGTLQINLSNGWNLLYDRFKDIVDKNDDIKTFDSVLMDITNRKPLKILKLVKGVKVFIFGGKHTGLVGDFQGFEKNNTSEPKQKRLAIISVNNNRLVVNLRNLIVVGSEKVEITAN